ncbi:DUF4037 domain-containing protein [Clostridium tertium]|uniref:DUF4037 domain-containing protein n=1 Tax=Clostridium tertium TaxID=1559 RepID=UPI0024B32545|nr:DUF4037 domain-containing protein [Clostridium tertium]MDI9218710.1 DUF4037 domain-containing protein [Clostridium tertium]
MDKKLNLILEEIISDFRDIKEVAAISFAGSSTAKRNDNLSDIDIDVFTYSDIPIEIRENIVSKYADYKEVGNDYWGQGDEFILRDTNTPIDIAYFSIDWIEDVINNILIKQNASVGYSTCFWHNVKNSNIIFEREGRLTQLKKITNCKYPTRLKKNIIEKNYPLLKRNISSYYNQISKAINRGDLNSINHRLSGFLASYFDIIFAINEVPHPGEKRLVNIVKNTCSKIPKNFEVDINNALKSAGKLDKTLLSNLDSLISNLDNII